MNGDARGQSMIPGSAAGNGDEMRAPGRDPRSPRARPTPSTRRWRRSRAGSERSRGHAGCRAFISTSGGTAIATRTGWRPYLRDVEISWTSEARFARDGDWAQSDDAFRFAPRDADLLVAMDADTFPIADLEPLFDRVHESGAVAGTSRTTPPSSTRLSTMQTRSLRLDRRRFAPPGRGLPRDSSPPPSTSPMHTHSMDPECAPEQRLSPFYVNFGVVLFPRAAFDAVAPRYLAIRPRVMERMSSPDFSGQAALTLAIADAGVRTWALPMSYNFPNDPRAEQLYPCRARAARPSSTTCAPRPSTGTNSSRGRTPTRRSSHSASQARTECSATRSRRRSGPPTRSRGDRRRARRRRRGRIRRDRRTSRACRVRPPRTRTRYSSSVKSPSSWRSRNRVMPPGVPTRYLGVEDRDAAFLARHVHSSHLQVRDRSPSRTPAVQPRTAPGESQGSTTSTPPASR